MRQGSPPAPGLPGRRRLPAAGGGRANGVPGRWLRSSPPPPPLWGGRGHSRSVRSRETRATGLGIVRAAATYVAAAVGELPSGRRRRRRGLPLCGRAAGEGGRRPPPAGPGPAPPRVSRQAPGGREGRGGFGQGRAPRREAAAAGRGAGFPARRRARLGVGIFPARRRWSARRRAGGDESRPCGRLGVGRSWQRVWKRCPVGKLIHC